MNDVATIEETLQRGHVSGQWHLLGLAKSYIVVDTSKVNEVIKEPIATGVNFGIAMVVPAQKIIETLNHPTLAAERKPDPIAVVHDGIA
jgi:hypothetical protein